MKLKFNKKRIKDLLFLKQNSCEDRTCAECLWLYNSHGCWFQTQPEWENLIETFSSLDDVRQMATICLKRIIFEEQNVI